MAQELKQIELDKQWAEIREKTKTLGQFMEARINHLNMDIMVFSAQYAKAWSDDRKPFAKKTVRGWFKDKNLPLLRQFQFMAMMEAGMLNAQKRLVSVLDLKDGRDIELLNDFSKTALCNKLSERISDRTR